MEDCDLPIVDLRSPVSAATRNNNRFKELLDVGCPVFDPFSLPTNGKDTTCSFPLERSNFVSAHAFGKPDGSGYGNVLAEAVVQEDLSPDAVGNCST